MFCNKCGNFVEDNQQYCNKCGNYLENNAQKWQNDNYEYRKSNSKIVPVIIIIISIALIILLSMKLLSQKKDYYIGYQNIDEVGVVEEEAVVEQDTKKGKYKTAIITDNVYSGISVNSVADAKKLISDDSTKQKSSDYPEEIIKIENDIIKKYSITAVNLKEMDVEFAKELEDVIANICENYPNARGHLTNLTLTNLNMMEDGVIALFRPTFIFGTSNTATTRPWVIKTQVQLNAKYFLNPERIEASVDSCSKSGHFPPNSTKYSPVAHELGHYLSFLAMLNHYETDSILLINDNKLQAYYNIIKDFGNSTFSKQMLDEAYQNYVRDNEIIDFDEWRGRISGYALAKDEEGEYIYDETIAEAFHDVYLNGDSANIVSKYIVEVLKKYV